MKNLDGLNKGKRMMNRVFYILCLLLTVLSSCIRDEIPPCPALSVQISVKDKNYFNVRKVDLEQALSEDLAFREYVPRLYYRLCPLGSDEAVAEQELFEVTGEDKTLSVRFPDELPHGTYVLTAWGGLKDLSSLDADRTSLTLHPGGSEGEDVYMTCDTLVYDAWNSSYTVEMERTKGKLIILASNLPGDIAWSGKSVSGLYGTVDTGFGYSGETAVTAEREWTPGAEVVTKTLLSPSRPGGSTLKLSFYDSPERLTPAAVPDDVTITVRRNELTVLKYVYEEGRFSVYILVNDNWEKVHDMIID